MADDVLVKLKNIEVRRGRDVLLKDIDLHIHRKEVISLIGLNGAGKTTLLKTILGVYKPSKGSVQVNTKHIGYVPQRLDFDRTIPVTVVEFLRTFASNRKKVVSVDQIRSKLKEVMAEDLLEKQVGVLSGGEMQRVLIANALLAEPELLLLDEAIAGVDIAGEHAFYDLIEKLHNSYEMAVVMVSHDIHTVFAKATRVWCLNKHLCCEGAPADVSENPEFKKLFCDHLAPYAHHHDHNH